MIILLVWKSLIKLIVDMIVVFLRVIMNWLIKFGNINLVVCGKIILCMVFL